jgi:hypothetical protein
MNLRARWGITLLIVVFPYLVLGIAGAVWLFQHGWWWSWLAVTATASLAVWLLARSARQQTGAALLGALPQSKFEPSPYWPPAGISAWRKIDELARTVDASKLPLDQPEKLWKLLEEVLTITAREFYPRKSSPMLEVPIPHVLRVIELVSQDLREALSANIPGAHILTMRDLQRVQEISRWVPWLYTAYRVGAAIYNPANAVMREAANWAQGDLFDASALQTKQWVLQFAIRRAGFYAIELYSGQLVLHEVQFEGELKSTQAARETARQRSEKFASEPFRILVLGQVKAGKSSLVNALFGETRAAVDVVPRTRHVEPYVLERDGLRQALILDTAGYDDATVPDEHSRKATSEVLRSDLILLVCSATTAAHAADRRLLEAWRTRFQTEPDREFPPLVVVLTHVDQLRPFREWAPPYDLLDAANAKSQSIRTACEATASDLQLPVEWVVPVCLAPDQIYNVNESLIPAVLDSLNTADRIRCLRCLREIHDEAYWRKVGEQAVNGGQILWKIGRRLFDEFRDAHRSSANLADRKG